MIKWFPHCKRDQSLSFNLPKGGGLLLQAGIQFLSPESLQHRGERSFQPGVLLPDEESRGAEGLADLSMENEFKLVNLDKRLVTRYAADHD